jgi:hypothetical protein
VTAIVNPEVAAEEIVLQFSDLAILHIGQVGLHIGLPGKSDENLLPRIVARGAELYVGEVARIEPPVVNALQNVEIYVDAL